MIVAMKKATVVIRRQEKQPALNKLRGLGVLHLCSVPAQPPSAQEWREKKGLLEKALSILSTRPSINVRSDGETDLTADSALAQAVVDRHDALNALREEGRSLDCESLRLQEWDGVCTADFLPLSRQGLDIRFYDMAAKDLGLLPENVRAFVIKRGKSLLRVALITEKDSGLNLGLKPLAPPGRNTAELDRLISQNRTDQEKTERRLEELAASADRLRASLTAATREIELTEAAAAMGDTESLSYLSGFLPVDRVADLQRTCRENSWALLIQDPGSDDDVPTVVRNKAWIDIIRPVFELLGTIPGYRENDISLFFLVFFTFFFAAIIGDGGYGLVMFTGTLFLSARLRKRGKPMPAILILMSVMSLATVLWGALTGTWFGSETMASLPFLSWMIVPSLSTFNPSSGETFKYIFFVVGTLHISIAHVWNFVRQLKEKPVLRAFTQLGWLFLVLGLYYLVLNLVLSSEKYPLPRHATWLMASGLLMVILFSQQSGRFLHGVAMGLANLLTTFLSSISAFSDIISYIRLFAVGLATIEISKSFNAMAAGLADGTLGIILASLVLLLGHSLNLAMGSLSVVVHGVRLNMLEFSGHLGMEWTGKPYKPFKE